MTTEYQKELQKKKHLSGHTHAAVVDVLNCVTYAKIRYGRQPISTVVDNSPCELWLVLGNQF